MDSKEDLVTGKDGGMKCDKNKDMWELAPWESFEQIIKIMTYGAKKYEPDNWKNVEINRLISAFMRHLVQWIKGEIIDKESGFRHTSHMATNAVFINFIDMRDNIGKEW